MVPFSPPHLPIVHHCPKAKWNQRIRELAGKERPTQTSSSEQGPLLRGQWCGVQTERLESQAENRDSLFAASPEKQTRGNWRKSYQEVYIRAKHNNNKNLGSHYYCLWRCLGTCPPPERHSSVAIFCGLPQGFEVENFKEIKCPGQNLHATCAGSSDSEDKFSNRTECLPEQTRLGQAARVWCCLSKGRLWHSCGMTSFSLVHSEMMKYENGEFKTQDVAPGSWEGWWRQLAAMTFLL